MNKLFLLYAMIFSLLTACGRQENVTATLPSVTPRDSSPVDTTPTPTKTLHPTTPPTSTITPLPTYSTKQIIFDYNVTGGLSDFDMFFEPNSLRSYSQIVLYSDGQMIIPGEIYRQKILSPSEINRFLGKLDSMGFYSLESNQAYDPTDKLYNFGNNYQKVYDAYLYCILVNRDKSRKLCVYEPGLPYLVPKMKQILNYLDNYRPAGMTPYHPDRILVSVQDGRHFYDENSPAAAVPWNDKFPSLETLNQKITYVDGDMAKEIYKLFDNVYEQKIFIENGREYTMFFSIIMPHEKVTNSYQ